MNTALQLGSLTLPYTLVLLITAIVLGNGLAERTERRRGAAPPPVARLLLLTAAVSRLAFVIQYPAYYLDAPWSVLDVRDGGWSP
ncbi:MAG: hypothetical protein AB7E55_08905 [Pigmentiphaga sp.]